MDLKYYSAILWRRKFAIVVTVTVTVMVALVANFLMRPRYLASSTLRIATASVGSFDSQRYDLTYADRLMNTYTKIAVGDPMKKELAQRLGTNPPLAVSAEIPANTELLIVSVEADTPTLAAQAANILAELLLDDFRAHYDQPGNTALETLKSQLSQIDDELAIEREKYGKLIASATPDIEQIETERRLIDFKETNYDRLLSQYEDTLVIEASRANTISVIVSAVPPSKSTKPPTELILGLSILVGLVAGVGLAFVFENLELYAGEEKNTNGHRRNLRSWIAIALGTLALIVILPNLLARYLSQPQSVVAGVTIPTVALATETLSEVHLPTQTPEVVPTATSSASPVPSITSTRTLSTEQPTSRPTDTEQPTLTPLPIQGTPTSEPYLFGAPRLLGPVAGARITAGTQVELKWETTGELGTDQWYDVQIWKDNEIPHGVAWTKVGSWTMPANFPPGKYNWRIVVIEGQGGKWVANLSPAPEPWSLNRQ